MTTPRPKSQRMSSKRMNSWWAPWVVADSSSGVEGVTKVVACSMNEISEMWRAGSLA